MILFILIEIAIIAWITFDKNEGTIACIRRDIRCGTNKVKAVIKNVWDWIWENLFLTVINLIIVFGISCLVFFVLCFTQPNLESQWSFNINALKDNLVTEGEFHGSMFSTRGYVDGEISYFYSRTMSKGETIGHIPADKTYIRYDNTVHPNIEVHQRQIDVPKWMYKVFFIEMMNGKTLDYYVIVAPEGTITNTETYQIDME